MSKRVNFNVDDEFYFDFKRKARKKGYRTVSEFFRQKARELTDA